MRLTLRTLLAYLDRMLPADQLNELKARVESNENASKIIERLQEALAQARLSAPKVDGKGFDGDPNVVAAYLDGSLPADKIVDFEKLCLESDRHLAEVAGVHRVLADMVELERNEASADRSELVAATADLLTPELRAKMIALPSGDLSKSRFAPKAAAGNNGTSTAERVVAKVAANQAAGRNKNDAVVPDDAELAAPPIVAPSASDTDAAEVVAPIKRKLEVPEYLREERRSIWPLALAGCLFLGAAGGATWFAMTRPDLGDVAKNQEDVEIERSTESTPTGAGSTTITEPKGKPTDASDTGDVPTEGSPESNAADPESTEPSPTETGETVVPPESMPDENPAPAGTPEEPSDPSSPDKAPPTTPDSPAPGETAPGATDPDAEPATEKVSPATSADVGRLAPGADVLLRLNVKNGEWMRAAARAPLLADDKFVVPPFFQPQMAFRSGIQATVLGPATFATSLPERETVGLQVDDGRMLLMGTGMEARVVPIKMGSITGEVNLVDAGSDAAIEVRHYLPPGSDPLAEPSPHITVLTIFAIHGPVVWQETGGDPVNIAPSHVRVIIRGESLKDELTKGPYLSPDWVEGNRLTALEKIAVRAVEPQLRPDRSIPLALKELPTRPEVQVFAARTLALLGDYEELLSGLSNENFRQAFWKQDIEALRTEVAKSPERAAAVKSALDRFCSGRSAVLFRFLRGFSAEQLADGGATELVDALESTDRDVRALAIVNLQAITNNLAAYNPSESIDRNRATISIWRKLLKEGKIVYKTPPTPMPEFRAASTGKSGE